MSAAVALELLKILGLAFGGAVVCTATVAPLLWWMIERDFKRQRQRVRTWTSGDVYIFHSGRQQP